MVFFGTPIEPRRRTFPGMDMPDVTDSPLQVDELSGLLTGWQKSGDGWHGQVEFAYPVHGYGMALRHVD